MRAIVLGVLGCLFAAHTFTSRAEAQTTFTVDALGTLNYTINGQPDPTLTLTRGTTYSFVVNASGHPFLIQTQPGIGPNRAYNDGVTNNGVEIGTLTFNVPQNAPAQLFYQCGVHSQMSGTINVVGGSAQGAPAGGLLSSLALGCLLAVAGLFYARRRGGERAGPETA